MISYYFLSNYLYNNKIKCSINNEYIIIFYGQKYHITIFQDQWDEYHNITNLPYYLFHVSSNRKINRCSRYYWVSKKKLKIQDIPKKYFKYQSSNYSYYSSTRQKCNRHDVIGIVKYFQTLLDHAIFLSST